MRTDRKLRIVICPTAANHHNTAVTTPARRAEAVPIENPASSKTTVLSPITNAFKHIVRYILAAKYETAMKS